MLQVQQSDPIIQPDISMRSSKTINNNASLSSEVIETLVSLSKYASLIELPNGIVVYFLKRSLLSEQRKKKQQAIQQNIIIPLINPQKDIQPSIGQNPLEQQGQVFDQDVVKSSDRKDVLYNNNFYQQEQKQNLNTQFKFVKNTLQKQYSLEQGVTKIYENSVEQLDPKGKTIVKVNSTDVLREKIQHIVQLKDLPQNNDNMLSSYQQVQMKLGHKVDSCNVLITQQYGIEQFEDQENESINNIRQKIQEKKSKNLNLVTGQNEREYIDTVKQQIVQVSNCTPNKQIGSQQALQNKQSIQQDVGQILKYSQYKQMVDKIKVNNTYCLKQNILNSDFTKLNTKTQKPETGPENRYLPLECFSPDTLYKNTEKVLEEENNLDDSMSYYNNKVVNGSSVNVQNIQQSVKHRPDTKQRQIRRAKIQGTSAYIKQEIEKNKQKQNYMTNYSPAIAKLKEHMRKYQNRCIAKITEDEVGNDQRENKVFLPKKQSPIRYLSKIQTLDPARQALNEIAHSLAQINQTQGSRALNTNARSRQQQQIQQNYQQHLQSNHKYPKNAPAKQQETRKSQSSESSKDEESKNTNSISVDNASQEKLVQCPQCQRSFLPRAFQVHERICAKVFQGKRKQFDSALKRMIDIVPNPQTVKRNIQAQNKTNVSPTQNRRQKTALPNTTQLIKQPKWKAQSEQLRQAMRATRGDQEQSNHAKTQQSTQQYDDRVECPHCHRKYQQDVAERHIPKCRNIVAKPSMLKSNGGKGAYARQKI